MTITLFKDERALARALALQIASTLEARPETVLGLPTGRTPIRLYHELGTLHAHRQLDFSRATTFNLDEFLGIGPDHPGSYRAFMEQHLFSRVNLSPDRINVLNGAAPDPERECERYEAAIAAAGGIDLQLLGIGTNGHIGFNEPGDHLPVRTHRVRLMESTRRDNAMLFDNDPSRVPTEALSMGIGTILRARRIVLVATGGKKAECIRQATSGRLTTHVPASMLQVHADVELILDREAASLI